MADGGKGSADQSAGKCQPTAPSQRRTGSRKRRRGIRGCRQYVCQKSIPPRRESLDEAGIFGGVTQGLAEPVDRSIQTARNVAAGVRGPQQFLEIFAGHNLTRALDHSCQNLKWLLLEFDLQALFAQFAGLPRFREEQIPPSGSAPKSRVTSTNSKKSSDALVPESPEAESSGERPAIRHRARNPP